MHRFFVAKPSAGTVSITGPDAKHAFKVLRLGPGDRFVAIIENEGQFISEIIEASTFELTAKIVAPAGRQTEPATRVWLFQGMPKGDKMESIVSRCTELGVEAIVPFESTRTVARPDGERVAGRLQRWRKIAQEAAELAGRERVPKITEPLGFSQALEMAVDFDLALMPWEEESSRSIGEVLLGSMNGAEPVRNVMLMIGPEGGFSAGEASAALSKGVVPVTLGPRMMRTENAGAVALALVLYQFGDMR
jgi:16S rRNA (uracil1498-N3)-methyltransferase